LAEFKQLRSLSVGTKLSVRVQEELEKSVPGLRVQW